MDAQRTIRFLYPPFFLLGSLLLGVLLDPDPARVNSLFGLGGGPWVENLSKLLVAGGVCVLPIGFLIGSLSILILKTIFLRKGRYETLVSADCRKHIWHAFGEAVPPNDRPDIFAIATFDHALLPRGINEWIGRRWNTFNVASHSIVALILALVIGGCVGVSVWGKWLVGSIGVMVVLAANASLAYRDTMGMLAFHARLWEEQGVDARVALGLKK